MSNSISNQIRRNVALIFAGGTIGGRIQSTGTVGAGSGRLTESLLKRKSRILGSAVNIDRVIYAYNGLSENMTPTHWTSLADAVTSLVGMGCKGIVITLGTDTLEYTSAALSLALKGVP